MTVAMWKTCSYCNGAGTKDFPVSGSAAVPHDPDLAFAGLAAFGTLLLVGYQTLTSSEPLSPTIQIAVPIGAALLVRAVLRKFRALTRVLRWLTLVVLTLGVLRLMLL